MMTEQEKQLLLKDLCARLPYGVQLNIEGFRNGKLTGIEGERVNTDHGINYPLRLCKPYLRPMSSMTDEEYMHCCAFLDDIDGCVEEAIPNYIDFLNEHHFDYRGLIEKGLALEAPEGMYSSPIQNK